VRSLARLLLFAGALAVGWYLLDARPHEVVLVYDVSALPGATALDVELRREGELVRRARLRLRGGEQARHPVKLREGSYELSWRAERALGAVAGARELVVTDEGTIVLPLAP
jgi:hypothetical protein